MQPSTSLTQRHDAYHSALTAPVRAKPVEWFHSRSITAFTHDLIQTRDLPAEFRRCDVIYADLPWAHGFAVFQDRAGQRGATFESFMRAVDALLSASVNQTFVLVMGKRGDAMLSVKRESYPCHLNGDPATAVVLNRSGARFDAAHPLEWAVGQAHCIGDFCCGYGRTGRMALRAGKPCVMSDVNPICIGYIAANSGYWER